MFKAFFFDMDGVLLDSMPHHIIAWQRTLPKYGIPFVPRDIFFNEGRKSREIITTLAARQGLELSEELVTEIYDLKTATYRTLPQSPAMRGMSELLQYISSQRIDGEAPQIYVVTGGGQVDLYEQLEGFYPGIFRRDRIITARDVKHGKPNPEPYLRAWERTGLPKTDCCIVENAPLGCQAGHAAEIFTVAVNTGQLTAEDLSSAGADRVFPDVPALLEWIKTTPPAPLKGER